MKTKGTAYAFEFCSLNAQQLTADVQKKLGKGFLVKRTSFQYRNPKNAPDPNEQKALTYFQNQLQQTGKLPPYYLQKIKQNGTTLWRYYKPLKIGGACLNCHGEITQMNPQILTLLRQKYPRDKATGYKIGDFRGVIRIQFPPQSTTK